LLFPPLLQALIVIASISSDIKIRPCFMIMLG